MNRQVLIDQLQETIQSLEKSRDLLTAALGEKDEFVQYLYQARKRYRRTCERDGKSGKKAERFLWDSCREAESLGWKGGHPLWIALLRIPPEFPDKTTKG